MSSITVNITWNGQCFLKQEVLEAIEEKMRELGKEGCDTPKVSEINSED